MTLNWNLYLLVDLSTQIGRKRNKKGSTESENYCVKILLNDTIHLIKITQYS